MKAIIVLTSTNKTYEEELRALCDACYIEVDGLVIQKLEKINPATYIGKGKVMEIKDMIDDHIVIFDNELSPLQIKNLTNMLECEVTDRTDLILRIFESRAKTKEAKLQVEIAKNKYMLSRLAGMVEHMSHQQGGMGFRGSGEKQIELDRRIIARKLHKANVELEEIVRQRRTQRERRKNNGIPVIALVGYTNSGKSTLMNALCLDQSKKVFQKDMLFATLETSSRQISLNNHRCILSDTVGFIDRLPHHLVQAFRSTLEEVKEADLLLHVVDSSSEDYQMQIDTTNEVLKSLGVKDTPMVYVYNKIDLNKYSLIIPQEPYVYISAYQKIGLDVLEKQIAHNLFKDYEIFELHIPYSEGEIFKSIHQHCHVLNIDYLEDKIYVKIEARRQEINQYSQYLIRHYS